LKLRANLSLSPMGATIRHMGRDTCTTRIHDRHRAMDPAAIKGSPARVDAVDQCGDQGKPRWAYLNDS
jgi:hypothetical protein